MYVKCRATCPLTNKILNYFEMVGRRERFQRRIISRWSDNHLPSAIFIIYAILSCFSLPHCSARDNITSSSLLSNGQTLVSAGERFELGFFSPADSSEAEGIPRYVGIWYYKSNPRIFVWVANRENPLVNKSGVLAILEDGNLKLLDESGTPYWYTDVESSSSPHTVAKLMDSGNFVLQDDQVRKNLWESFKYPTDTFLAGMYMGENLSLTSWAGHDDPKPGNFTFKMDQGENQYQITKPLIRHWRSAESKDVFSSNEIIPYQILNLLSNFSHSVKPTGKNAVHPNLIVPSIDYSRTRLIMNYTGEIQYWTEDKVKGWSLIWWEPRDNCSIFHYCGNSGICNSNSKPKCQCLQGFVPLLPESWNSQDFSGGCTTKTALCGAMGMFLRLKVTKVGKTDSNLQVKNETECSEECLSSCRCQAYSYEESDSTRKDNPSDGGTCWIWTEELNDLQQGFSNGSRDLCVRVASRKNDELTKRNCETCGTNLIPYPLSTKEDCGDPRYFSFLCNTSTGQINFMAPSGTYSVTGIYPDSRNFSIQLKGADNYRRNPNGTFELNQSLPFYFIALANRGNSTFDLTSMKGYEVEIGWDPPREPTCTSSRDCEDWPHSACNLTNNGERRCLCKETFRWDGNALNCTQGKNGNYSLNGYDICATGKNVPVEKGRIRFPSNGWPDRAENKPGGGSTQQVEASNGRNKQRWTLIFGVTIASGIILSFIIFYFYTRRKRINSPEGRSINRPNMAARFYESARLVKDMVDSNQFKEEDKKGIDLPFIDFESILAATDNFSEANKLGKGGFGPVYMGMFPGGQQIAVKRLSSASGQGLEEFKNELLLIGRLQHRNLVRLVGYCIEGQEKILLYEYMPNKSLDFFIFDPTLSVLLDWEMRFNIILGVARGLLYLHQDSRLRIIHRDLKTSNILLDHEMNPKISDFGLARIFEGKQTEGTTNRVVGTYGYMSPEYALGGFFSVKSDVFSFGVVVLEIISGKRNTGFYNSELALSLLGYAWKLWQEGKALDMMDQKPGAISKANEILKCINVGLLCVQEDPNDRPTMSDVVIMLGSEAVNLASPKRPAFVVRRGSSSSASTSNKPESNNELTHSLEGR